MSSLPSTAAVSTPSRHRGWAMLVAVGIAAVVLVAFSPAFRCGFVQWDDDLNITKNAHLAQFDWKAAADQFLARGGGRYYAPLTWLHTALLYRAFDLRPQPYHVSAVLAHAAAAAMLFFVLQTLLRKRYGELRRESLILIVSAVAALAWALHPLTVEATVWLAAGLFYPHVVITLLASLLAYVYFTDKTKPPGRRRLAYAAALGLYVSSLLFTSLVPAFAVLMLGLDLTLLQRLPMSDDRAVKRRQWRRIVLEKVPFVLLGAGILGFNAWLAYTAPGAFKAPPKLDDFGVFPRLMQAAYVWTYYLWKPLVPTGLAPVYTTLVRFDPWGLRFVLSLAAVLGLSILALRAWRRGRWGWGVVWACHLLLVLPMLGLLRRPHFTSDRYAYVPLLLWVVAGACVVLGQWERVARWGRGAIVGAVAVLLVLATLTWRQAGVWRDSESLFHHMLVQLGNHPYQADIQWRLGSVLLEQRRYPEAAACFAETLRVDPRHARSISMLADAELGWGRTLVEQGDRAGALQHLEFAAKLKPALRPVVEKVLQGGAK